MMTMEQDQTAERRCADHSAAEATRTPPGEARAATPPWTIHRTNAGSLVPLTELFRAGSRQSPGEATDQADPAGAAVPQTEMSGAGRTSAAALKHRGFPCGPCPFRRDAPLGVFTPQQFEDMRKTCRSADGHAAVNAPLFGCHPGEPGTDDDLACAGWLAVEGRNSLRVGLAIAFDRLPDTVLDPGPGWPELYGSFEEMVEANHTAGQRVTRGGADTSPAGSWDVLPSSTGEEGEHR
ncbi:DUF6283 family protein [Nonomuraea sp. NPDC046802]|uniref:DUF6283 family protein n=1 Tax=Nonomuraea sp. NPDC046802 TaxID=3154919 RepID=UPI0033DCC5D5